MGGDDGADEQLSDDSVHLGGCDARVGDLVERKGQAALLRRRADGAVVAATAVVMHVFGNVGQERKPRKRPYDVEGIVNSCATKHLGERSVGSAITAMSDCCLPGPFHEREGLLARVFTHHVA